MIETNARTAESRIGSLSFVAVGPETGPTPRPVVSFPGLPVVSRLLQELGQPLAQLARQARRAGPVGRAAVVLLTGCGEGVGCSTVALALAAAAVRERAVLLLDAHLDRAGLSGWLLHRPEVGWDDAVGGRCSLEQCMLYPDGQGLLPFLPLRQPVADPESFVREPALRAWLTGLRRDHGLLVLDAGPVETLPSGWTHLVDGTFLVGPGGPETDWARAWDRLEEQGLAVLGVVETLVER